MAARSPAGIRLRLPTGREAAIVEGLRFCYDLSETDAMILFELLRSNKSYAVDELTEKLGLSKATVNRGLGKLVELGFAAREREQRRGVGRPRYRYYIPDPDKVIERMINDFEECARAFKEALRQLLEEIKKEREKEKTGEEKQEG